MNNKKNDIDIFHKYLKSEEKYIKIALTDSSYKNYCEKHNLSFCDDNKNLATLGDAIIKFVYAKMLYNECKNKKYSKEIEKYITDEKLVRIASKYYLIQYIDLDEDDDKISLNYEKIIKELISENVSSKDILKMMKALGLKRNDAYNLINKLQD